MKYPQRKRSQLGKVLVIGGSPQYHEAPILTALGAEAAGADLIHLYTCPNHLEAAKKYSLNFFLYGFAGHTGSLGLYDVKIIHEIMQNVDAVVIGNGIGKDFDAKKAVLAIINSDKPIVIDGDALVPELLKIYNYKKHRWILTPHRMEFERVFGVPASPENILEMSKQHRISLCVKGTVDYIATGNDFSSVMLENIIFEPLNQSHFQLLLKWLEMPHVKKWWDQDITHTIDSVQEKYFPYTKGYKKMDGIEKPIQSFIINVDHNPIGYIQIYNAYDFPRNNQLLGLPENLGAIDIFIGEDEYLGQNIGSKAISKFLKLYERNYSHVFVDPDSSNFAAIKCYEAAGFKKINEQNDTDEVLMLLDNRDMKDFRLHENHTGVPEMSVKGTGDALAGIICSYVSQGFSASQAMQSATYLFGKCGEAFVKKSATFSAKSLVKFFPKFNAEKTI
jgi:NAD(P)H-hydrate repair Nnr-like enzyme with NAD(P)H-hydrate dehydratase domain/ribosomal protein S18 acetylase RimI-like enzyme